MIVGQSNYCPACGSSDSSSQSLGVNPFLDKKIITDGRKNHLCQTFREMLEEKKEEDGGGGGEEKEGEKEGEKKVEEQASMEEA